MRNFFHTNPYTKWSAVLIFVVILGTLLKNESWKDPNEVIASDVKGYYGFLPALFIHNDLQFTNGKDYIVKGDPKLWYSLTDDNKKFIKYPPGMAVLYSPFFLAAHASTSFVDAEPNGYSYPYQIGLLICILFYTLLGLYFMSKLLLRHFKDRVAASTILVVYLATNLFFYSTYDFALTHGYSFALLAAFLYGTIRWVQTSHWRYVFLLGISGGLLVAVRNIDLIFLCFILLYDVRSMRDFKKRGRLLIEKRWQVLVGLGCILLMLAPQILYNLYISGSLLMYAYTDEHFFFGAPHLFDSILSYRSGWLVYTPAMILAVIGFFFLRKRAAPMLSMVVFSVPIYYYILASWWCWWFVGFGNRAYINLYPLLAFAIAALFSYLYDTKRWKLYLVNCFVLGAILLNWFQSAQFKLGIIHWEGMNHELYWHVFGREARSQSQDLLVQAPDNDDAKNGRSTLLVPKIDTLSHQHYSFETRSEINNNSFHTSSKAHSGKASIFVPVNTEESKRFTFTIPKGTTHISIKAWVQGDGESFIAVQTNEPTPFHYYSDEVIATQGEWRRIEILATPFEGVTYSTMDFYLWNRGMKPSYIDDVTVNCLRVTTVKKTP